MSEGPSGHQTEGREPDPEATLRHGPTEITPPYAPTEVTTSYGPTEVTTSYGPTQAASPYSATPYAQTEAASPYGATQAASPYRPAGLTRRDPGIPGSRPAGQTGRTADRASGAGRPQELVRYGPGVPPSEASPGLTAEHVWRTGSPGKPTRRPPRLRRLLGSALTVALLAASGVVLYLRFHHAPFHVTGVAITQHTPNGCGVNVTGRIDTNGAAGTVSYQWVFRPDPHPPQPLSQSVVAGQRAVYVTVAVEGSGHGSASQSVTLQVLGPDRAAAPTTVTVSCR